MYIDQHIAYTVYAFWTHPSNRHARPAPHISCSNVFDLPHSFPEYTKQTTRLNCKMANALSALVMEHLQNACMNVWTGLSIRMYRHAVIDSVVRNALHHTSNANAVDQYSLFTVKQL